MNYRNKSFKGERVELSDNIFHDRVFENCELVFDGHRSPTFKDNRFVDSEFVFTGPAVRTLYLISNIYHAGPGGQEIIEQMFDEIRQRRFHGREVRTIAPHTVNHSLTG